MREPCASYAQVWESGAGGAEATGHGFKAGELFAVFSYPFLRLVSKKKVGGDREPYWGMR